MGPREQLSIDQQRAAMFMDEYFTAMMYFTSMTYLTFVFYHTKPEPK